MEANLIGDPDFREAYVRYVNLHVALSAAAGTAKSDEQRPPGQVVEIRSGSGARTVWNPFVAAAVGLILGLLGASVAWAIAPARNVATAERLPYLFDGSFELKPGAVAPGFPSAFGEWSGDEAEVVGTISKNGRQALRFVRAEGDPIIPNSPANSCDIYQLVDLRSIKEGSADGEATLELSAQFLDKRSLKGEPVHFNCRLFVFSGSPEVLRDEWPLSRREALASGSDLCSSTGGAGDTWKTVTAKVLLPAGADYALVQVVAGKAGARSGPAAGFGEQFVDDVRLTLKTQPKLPVRIAKSGS